ncbi:hypothetical phage protein [Campylobacter phage CPt10]|uniref:Tail fiber protein n=2 Tax=Firehammervirus CPt10 TaxID=722418 RepID=A0A410T7L3_9CAUD|nr:hypothetical protein APL46_gp197 [Campylobacter phage CPt10]QAU04871.1 hypothetical protein [Campylobacter phage CP20]CBJ94335.1 hypothetical phage protein [Campylobacter phage CPt10]
MQFKKVDVLISENLTKEQLKEKVLTELNKISKESNPSISYIANIHDIVNGKYWICMDSETKETMGASDELIDLQAIFRHTTENPDEASRDLLYSSKYIEDNFLRKIIFETYKEANDSRLTKLETTVGTNEKDIEDKHYKLEKRVTTAENTITDNRELEDTRYGEYTQFKKNIENNILSINNTLNAKANLGGSETQVFNVADPTSDWHAINLAYAKKNFNADLINTHKTDFNNPHKTSIVNLIDTSIVGPANNHILQYDSNTRKWKNAVLSVDLSNYYNKSEVDSKLGTKANTNNVYNKSEINTKLQDVLAQADNRYPTLLTQNLEWTVGVGGKFTNLQTAINEAAKFINNKDYILTLKLISNIEANNPIYIRKLNIPFVNIDFNGFKVKITSETIGFYIWSSKIGKILKPYVESYSTCFYFLNSTCEQIGFADTSYTCKLSCSKSNVSAGAPISGIQAGTGAAVIFMGKFQFLTPDINKHCFTSSGVGVLSYRNPTEVIQPSGVAFNVVNGGLISNSGVTVTGGASKNSQTPNVVSESGIIFG